VAVDSHAIAPSGHAVPAHDAHGHDAHGHGAHGHGDHDGHGLLHHHFDDLDQQREATSLGMWSFLATEVMMFGGLFFAYTLYRGKFPVGFHEGSKHLLITWGTANTFVLLFSSLTMALAVHAAQEGKRNALVGWLIATMVLGGAFLGIKGVEWGVDYHEGLIPTFSWFYYEENPAAKAALIEQGGSVEQVLMYFALYFCMTGLHAFHMVIGLIAVGLFTWLGAKGNFTNGNDQPVELLGLYWHFVDIVWVFLFPLLYLIAGFHPFGPPGGH
jgi:cytochrome c oxidase subunit III